MSAPWQTAANSASPASAFRTPAWPASSNSPKTNCSNSSSGRSLGFMVTPPSVGKQRFDLAQTVRATVIWPCRRDTDDCGELRPPSSPAKHLQRHHATLVPRAESQQCFRAALALASPQPLPPDRGPAKSSHRARLPSRRLSRPHRSPASAVVGRRRADNLLAQFSAIVNSHVETLACPSNRRSARLETAAGMPPGPDLPHVPVRHAMAEIAQQPNLVAVDQRIESPRISARNLPPESQHPRRMPAAIQANTSFSGRSIGFPIASPPERVLPLYDNRAKKDSFCLQCVIVAGRRSNGENREGIVSRRMGEQEGNGRGRRRLSAERHPICETFCADALLRPPCL